VECRLHGKKLQILARDICTITSEQNSMHDNSAFNLIDKILSSFDKYTNVC